MNKILTICFILLLGYANAQTTFKITGKVTDDNNVPLFGAAVAIHELQKGTITNDSGYFKIDDVQNGEYHLHISYLGYKCVHYNTIRIENADTFIIFTMQPDNVSLDEIVIQGNSTNKIKQQSTTSIEIIDDEYISRNLNTNIIKSMETLPGISSMDIGQGFSKPIIRGLGFNRVAVTENGIKQEGQQWGADHGLEIDQFGVERVEIIKGPASLAFGSDAIGGVIQIMPNDLPPKNSIEGSVQTIYKSVNQLFGSSAMCKYRNNDWNFYTRFTHTQFADYQVPADSFFYNRYRFPIINRTLKNTAGKEQDIFFTVGIIKNQYKSTFSFSNVFSQVGFFPGSHGIPSANKLQDDGNSRNIDLPYQKVNHFKIISNTKYYLPKGSIEMNLGYQNNFRQEWSLFHTHYQNQTPPMNNPDLELEFRLNTLSADIKYKFETEKNTFETGISSQHQINDIDGYMFLLPKYSRTTLGIFAYNKYMPNSKIVIDGGLRFDYGNTKISDYYSIYAERYKSKNFEARFYDFTWALGFSYMFTDNLNFKSNIGKSYRMPNVSELSANGIHHGSFRYEVGDTAITSEYSYQFDIGLYYSSKKITVEVSPFVNYFPNFIYLSPTGSYLHPDGYEISEADAGQVYQYLQSKAFRAGIELLLRYELSEKLNFTSSAEYVYATDYEYPIPFTPPLNIHIETSYSLPKLNKYFENTSLDLSGDITFSQNRVARNEPITNGYNIYNVSFSTDIKISNFNANFAVKIQNIFNTNYFNHLSFYRIIELPEVGRNVQLSLKIPINHTFKP